MPFLLGGEARKGGVDIEGGLLPLHQRTIARSDTAVRLSDASGAVPAERLMA
jgi:hypothetical protein